MNRVIQKNDFALIRRPDGTTERYTIREISSRGILIYNSMGVMVRVIPARDNKWVTDDVNTPVEFEGNPDNDIPPTRVQQIGTTYRIRYRRAHSEDFKLPGGFNSREEAVNYILHFARNMLKGRTDSAHQNEGLMSYWETLYEIGFFGDDEGEDADDILERYRQYFIEHDNDYGMIEDFAEDDYLELTEIPILAVESAGEMTKSAGKR